MVTTHPARALGLPGLGVVAGAAADLVILDAERVADALISLPARLATFKAGKLIVRTSIERTWYHPGSEPAGGLES
jgi:cytosine deaminase